MRAACIEPCANTVPQHNDVCRLAEYLYNLLFAGRKVYRGCKDICLCLFYGAVGIVNPCKVHLGKDLGAGFLITFYPVDGIPPVKNFIILVLLIVNVVLLSTVISDRMRGSELWNEAVEGAVALLEENGIVVSDEANLSARSLNQRSVARNGQVEAQAVDGFIGLTTTDDRGGGIIYYGGTKGEATFRGTGGFGIQFFASGAPETDDPEKTARSMARDLGIELVDGKDACTIVESDGDNVVLELACASGGARIINCRVEFRFMYGRLYSISGVRPLDLVTAETETSLIDVPTALMRFLGLTREKGHICSELRGLELCYAFSASASGEGSLTPTWLIVTDTGEFYINAITGKEEVIA